MSEELRKVALVGLGTQYEVCAFLPEHEILAELKIKFSKSDPGGGYFVDPDHYWERMAELENVLRLMHEQWVEDNAERFDEYLAEGEAYRFLSWDIVGRTLLFEDACEYLNDLLSLVEEIEDGYEYDIDDVWTSLEECLSEDDAHFYAVEWIYDACEDGERQQIMEYADGDPYEGFYYLIWIKARECCDIGYSGLIEKIKQSADEIAEELREREAFEEGHGNSWYRLFEDGDGFEY